MVNIPKILTVSHADNYQTHMCNVSCLKVSSSLLIMIKVKTHPFIIKQSSPKILESCHPHIFCLTNSLPSCFDKEGNSNKIGSKVDSCTKIHLISTNIPIVLRLAFLSWENWTFNYSIAKKGWILATDPQWSKWDKITHIKVPVTKNQIHVSSLLT